MFTSTLSLEISTSFYVIGIIIGVIMVFTKTLTIVGHYKNIKKKNTNTTPKHYLYYNVSKDTSLLCIIDVSFVSEPEGYFYQWSLNWGVCVVRVVWSSLPAPQDLWLMRCASRQLMNITWLWCSLTCDSFITNLDITAQIQASLLDIYILVYLIKASFS